jgi:methyl-accepting chemotaxis protein
VLRKGYHKAQETDNMETSFIHYMTNQMTVPSETLERTVTNLCNNYRDLDETKFTKQVEAIKSKSEAIINLLDETLKVVENIKGKEADNE